MTEGRIEIRRTKVGRFYVKNWPGALYIVTPWIYVRIQKWVDA